MTATKQKLYAKLFEVAKAAQPVEKRGHAEEGYDFARYEDVLAEASRCLEEQGILIVPQVVEEKLAFSRVQPFAIATAVMEFEVVDTETGFSITRRWSGTGHDNPGDKALFTAQTGCEKYFLARLLRIPFGIDPEDDATSAQEVEVRRIRQEQDQAAETPQDLPSASLSQELDASAAAGVS